MQPPIRLSRKPVNRYFANSRQLYSVNIAISQVSKVSSDLLTMSGHARRPMGPRRAQIQHRSASLHMRGVLRVPGHPRSAVCAILDSLFRHRCYLAPVSQSQPPTNKPTLADCAPGYGSICSSNVQAERGAATTGMRAHQHTQHGLLVCTWLCCKPTVILLSCSDVCADSAQERGVLVLPISFYSL